MEGIFLWGKLEKRMMKTFKKKAVDLYLNGGHELSIGR